MKRPDRWDKRVIEAVAPKVVASLLKWEPLDEGESIDDLTKTIANLLDDATDWDGANLASDLKQRNCWDISESLVDALSCAEHHRWVEHKKLVCEWVQETQPRPPFVWGEIVFYQYGWRKIRRGEIFQIKYDTAQYVINDDIKKALNKGNDFVCGAIVDWEDCW